MMLFSKGDALMRLSAAARVFVKLRPSKEIATGAIPLDLLATPVPMVNNFAPCDFDPDSSACTREF